MLAQLSEGIPGDKESGKREATQDKKKKNTIHDKKMARLF